MFYIFILLIGRPLQGRRSCCGIHSPAKRHQPEQTVYFRALVGRSSGNLLGSSVFLPTPHQWRDSRKHVHIDPRDRKVPLQLQVHSLVAGMLLQEQSKIFEFVLVIEFLFNSLFSVQVHQKDEQCSAAGVVHVRSCRYSRSTADDASLTRSKFQFCCFASNIVSTPVFVISAMFK